MSYKEISRTKPKARKPHRCIWCGETIKIDEVHERVVSTYHMDFQNHRFHLECVGPCADECREMGGEFEPFENKRGAKNE